MLITGRRLFLFPLSFAIMEPLIQLNGLLLLLYLSPLPYSLHPSYLSSLPPLGY